MFPWYACNDLFTFTKYFTNNLLNQRSRVFKNQTLYLHWSPFIARCQGSLIFTRILDVSKHSYMLNLIQVVKKKTNFAQFNLTFVWESVFSSGEGVSYCYQRFIFPKNFKMLQLVQIAQKPPMFLLKFTLNLNKETLPQNFSPPKTPTSLIQFGLL